jgi:hypothetical protein
MKLETSAQQLAGAAAILSGVVSFVSIVVALAATHFRPADLNQLTSLKVVSQFDLPVFRESLYCDFLGYSILLLPLVSFIHVRFRERQPFLVTLATMTAVGYIIVNAAGVAAISIVVTTIPVAYTQVSPVSKEALEVIFTALMASFYTGVGHVFEAFIAGIWWALTSIVLWPEWRSVRLFGAVLAVLALADGLIALAGLEQVVPGYQSLGYAWLVLQPVWAIWTGVVLLKAATVLPVAPA